MTEEQHDLVIKLREKIRRLITLYEKEKEVSADLRKECDELKNRISVKNKEYEIIDKKYDTLKLAKVISGGNGETHEAKIKVNKIVREIDKCIALLNK